MRLQRLSIGSQKLPVCLSSLGCVLAGTFLAAWGVPQQAWASPAATTTTLTVTSGGNAASTVASGSVVTLTAAVTSGGSALTLGQVNFCDATVTYCTDIHLLSTAQLTSAGTAVLKFVPGPGSHSYKAVFAGTTAAATSASAVQSLTVTPAAPGALKTTISISSSEGTNSNNIYTLTTVISGNGSASPSGTVSFLDTSNANTVLGTAPLVPVTVGSGFVIYPVPTVNGGGGEVEPFVTTGDFNGDGIPDLVSISSEGEAIEILLGNADGTFGAPLYPAKGFFGGISGIAVGDFNGDGVADLLVGSEDCHTVTVLLGKGDGTFTVGQTLPVGGFGFFISTAVADFNGDGKLDIAVASVGSNVTILLGNGDGTFTAAANPFQFGGSLAVADFNGDGKPDLAVATDNGTKLVKVLLGNGDGSFTAAADQTTGGEPDSITAADFNGDGKIDLAVANSADNTVTILLGNGDGTFTAAASPMTGAKPESISVGDFNGDGKPDLASANFADNTVTILLGNGDGTFQTGIGVPTGAALGPVSMAVADFNGDGKPDVAVSSSGYSVEALLADTQSSTATATNISPVGAGTHLVDASFAADANYGANASGAIPLLVVAPNFTVGFFANSSNAGTAKTLNITINPTGGFTGTVTLSCAFIDVPQGAVDLPTCSAVTPAVVTGNSPATGTVIVSSQPTTTPATYNLAVTATSGGITATTTDQFVVYGPSFQLASPAQDLAGQIFVAPGASTSTPITITPSLGFTGNVALTCIVTGTVNLPTCSLAPFVAVTGNTVTTPLTLNAQSATTPVQYAVDVTGTSGILTSTVQVNVIVAAVGFSLNAGPIAIQAPGSSGSSTIQVDPSGGFSGVVTLSCAVTGIPVGAVNIPTCNVFPTMAYPATLTVNTQATVSPGSYTVTVTGVSGNITSTTSVTVTVPAAPSFKLSGTPVSIASPGASGTSTITVSPNGGLTGNVMLSCAVTGGPTGGVDMPTCSVTAPPAITGNSAVTATLTVNTQAASSPGSYTVTVTGAGGSLNATTSFTVVVPAAPSFTLSSTAVTIASVGASGTSTITLTPSGGFAGSVALSCAVTGSPMGAAETPTCSVSAPNAISGNSTVTATLTVSTTAASAVSTRTSNNIAPRNPLRRILPLGGATMAALLFLAPPVRRRRWNRWLGLLLFAVFAGAAIGCGGARPTAPAAATNPGTTAGSYTVTVTGMSGATMATTAVTVTVI
jgi:hypothetical protein